MHPKSRLGALYQIVVRKPYREAQEHGVAAGHRGVLVGQGGPGGLVVHLHAAAGLLIGPIQVGPSVGDLGLDLIEVGIRHLCQCLCHSGGGAAGRKVRH